MKDMLFRSVILILLAFSFTEVFSQCEVTASASPDNVVCGDCAILSAFGQGQGISVFIEDFNSGSPTGWAFTQQAMWNNPCSPNGVDGTTHIWMGDNSGVPRSLETISYNLTTATAGVTICFDMLFSEQGNNAPCEGPDEPDEGVYLQYSINGGATWVTINYFDPNGGGDPDLINWNNWCFQLPAAAITSQTQIRWFQDNDSGAEYDHWGIDNVNIYFNDPTYEIIWQHDNYSYGQGSSGGANPNQVCPRVNTSYTVVMSNGTSTCSEIVLITVDDPNIIVHAGNDTTICLGDCATLNAEAKVIKRPAKTPTYENNEFEAIANAFGSVTNININVQGLNMPNILPNSITEVCLNGLTFFGVNLFPPGQQTIGDLNIYLVCPDGTRILLIPSGTTLSSTPLDGYTNTCFTLASVNNIASASVPYTGDFMPGEPFNNLTGCISNGVWTIEVSPTSVLGFGIGTFFGWSITFDDPEISYVADFTWNPTSGLSDPNILNPITCPTSDQTYLLTATDTAGCVIASDSVTITVDSACCVLEILYSVINPACNAADGAIDITITSGSGNYSFDWSNGLNTEDLSGLIVGIYSVTITDNVQSCQRDTSFSLTTTGGPQLDTVLITPETCAGDNDGSISVTASGGTGTLNYIWSTGQSGTGLSTLTNLGFGSYSVTVEDTNSCFVQDSFTIDPGPVCCTLEFDVITTAPSCGASNGAIDITITNGAGSYDYTWSTGSTSEDINGLSAGAYSLTIIDLGGPCQKDTIIILSSANAPVIDSISIVHETCAGDNDGSATVYANGGTGTISFIWSNAQSTQTISNLTPGIYNISVSDSLNCTTVGVANIQAGSVCCNLSSTITIVDASCNGNDGSITISVDTSTGLAPFEYSIDGSTFGSSNSFSNISTGSYTTIVRDAQLCTDTNVVIINAASNSLILFITVNALQCHDDSNGNASVQTSGGAPPYSYTWSTGSTDSMINNLSAGTYLVTVTDQDNCETLDTINLLNPLPVIVTLNDLVICSGGNAQLDAGLGFSQYLWSTGDTNQTIMVTLAGNYFVTVSDGNNCSNTDTATITLQPNPQLFINPTDTTISNNTSITLTASVFGLPPTSGLFWSPSDGLSCNNCSSPTATPDQDITYTVVYSDPNGCFDTATVSITVEQGEYYTFVPNAFSPNGDGLNDVLVIFHKGLSSIEFKIFDRWGSKVFETSNPAIVWDGTYKGQLSETGVYVYMMEANFLDSTTKRTKGSITLLR